MISEILTYLNSEFEQLNLFTKYYTLSEQISRGQDRFPAIFEKEFEGLKFGQTDSLVYHQLSGRPSFAEVESISGCGVDFNYKIPLKVIGCLTHADKTKYTPYNIAEAMSVILMRSNDSDLKRLVKARVASVFSTGFEINSEAVFRDQFSGDYKIDDRFFILVNYEVTLQMSKNCFDINCFK